MNLIDFIIEITVNAFGIPVALGVFIDIWFNTGFCGVPAEVLFTYEGGEFIFDFIRFDITPLSNFKFNLKILKIFKSLLQVTRAGVMYILKSMLRLIRQSLFYIKSLGDWIKLYIFIRVALISYFVRSLGSWLSVYLVIFRSLYLASSFFIGGVDPNSDPSSTLDPSVTLDSIEVQKDRDFKLCSFHLDEADIKANGTFLVFDSETGKLVPANASNHYFFRENPSGTCTCTSSSVVSEIEPSQQPLPEAPQQPHPASNVVVSNQESIVVESNVVETNASVVEQGHSSLNTTTSLTEVELSVQTQVDSSYLFEDAE